MKVGFQWNMPLNQVVEEALGGSAGRLFLANEAKRLMDPYVPADNLILAQNVRVYAEGENSVVHYLSPYAHYQYMGEVYGPNYPIKEGGIIVGWCSPSHKTPTGKKIKHSKFRHPLATSEWDKAMMTARKDDLAKAYQRYLNGGKS